MYGQFIVIFALMLTGYFFRKINVISDEMNQGLNKFIVYFSFPCFIFHKVANLDMSKSLMSDFLIAFALSCGLFLIYGLYAWGYSKIRRFPKERANVAELVSIFSNNAFMGFPITYIFFGEQGLLFMLANNIAMNLLIFSYGVFLMRRNDEVRKISGRTLIKCIFNPNIIALACGLLFCVSRLSMPEAFNSYLVHVGNICTPMTMIFIGSTLVGTKISEVIKDRIVMEPAFNKNIMMPVLTYLILAWMPVPRMIVAIVAFAACFPSATVATVLVETEGQDSELACKILVVSTAVSIVTLPIAVKLINLLIL